MPTITVYKNNNEISYEAVKQEYYIVETPSEELRWFEKDIEWNLDAKEVLPRS